LKNVELSLLNPAGGKQAFFGELLFTHFGLSGPIVLTASELIGQWVDASKQPVQAYLDLKPALSDEQLNRRLLRELEAHSRKQLGSVLKELLPQRLISIILELSELPAEHPNHQVTREERLRLVGVLKNLPLTITGTLPVAAAIVTAGGVDLKEVDPKTMESKLHKGLYFIGEVLDVNGVTGGFNLQAAFSTAYCAAHAVEL
jgi:predicted Rossmann fold flavoprotein